MHIHERKAERKRLGGRMARAPRRGEKALRDLGGHVYADGAISKKHKELTALAVAVSQNCFD